MTDTARVTLAGIPIGGQNAYEWPLTSGTAPHQATFEVTKRVWSLLEPFAGISAESPGLTYVVTRDGREVQRVERLFIVDAYPGANADFTKRIRVVDRRWLWSRTHVATSYNVRRTVGKTLVVSDGQNAETPDLIPEVVWAKYSLRDESTAWTAEEVLRDVFRKVNGLEPEIRGDFTANPVDDLVLDDSGDAAIERVLAYFPGASVFLDRKGRPVVKDSLDRSEVQVFDRFKDLQQLSKGVDLIDRRWSRPSRVVVLFTPEIDIRFNYEEAPSGTIVDPEDSNRLYNVAQVTEPTGLFIDSQTRDTGQTPKTHGPGSWAKMTDLFTAWGAGPGLGPNLSAARSLSFDILRKSMGGNFRFLAREFIYSEALAKRPDPVWVRRINAATAAYRRTFRIARDFMSRLESVRPVRASVISSNTGARASSPVYSDYMVRPSFKGFAVSRSGGGLEHGIAQRGYADLITSSAIQPAPVRIQMLDPGAGIFQLVPKQTDAKGYYEAVMLGYPDTSLASLAETKNYAAGVPVQSLGTFDPSAVVSYSKLWEATHLEADWKFATIMSCVPASPNDVSRFYAVELSAGELGEDAALGPPVFVRVYPGVITARFAWIDGDDGQAALDRIRGNLGPDPDNAGWPSQLVNFEHVKDVAKASARRVYEQFRDRPFGSMQVDSQIAGEVEPTGLINRVAMRMDGGATVTRIDFGTVAQPAEIWRYLPASTRRALLRSQLSLADPLGSALGFA